MTVLDTSFGNGDVLLWMLEFFLFVIWFWLLLSIFGDLFRDHETSGGVKAVWVSCSSAAVHRDPDLPDRPREGHGGPVRRDAEPCSSSGRPPTRRPGRRRLTGRPDQPGQGAAGLRRDRPGGVRPSSRLAPWPPDPRAPGLLGPRAVRDPEYLADMSDFTIRALTPETFDDFAALIERNKGMFASCWCTWFHPDCAERGVTAEGNRALKQHGLLTASPTRRWSTTATWPSPGRSTARPTSCPRSTTARSTSPPPSASRTTGSRASRSSGTIAVRGWRRSPCAGPWSSSRRPAAAWSRATPTTPAASGRRTRPSSTTAPARCTSARGSPTTGPRARATA